METRCWGQDTCKSHERVKSEDKNHDLELKNLPIVIDQLDGVVGITEAETSLDFHAKFS